jgi:hypothetical protein
MDVVKMCNSSVIVPIPDVGLCTLLRNYGSSEVIDSVMFQLWLITNGITRI